ncbi:hypothetical protein FQA39_LY05871 [Lamprigera yunnana]|nr:hypothetical protein FQA39_LY05871 [Lamprigera yunnana]
MGPMACDMFSIRDATELLRGRYIYFFGDSNVRGIYKDLLWLLEYGPLTPEVNFKKKNERSYAHDRLVSNSAAHNGCNYEEWREYHGCATIKFYFLTKVYNDRFVKLIKTLRTEPDIIFINSCLWDLTRWGKDGVEQFKTNIYYALDFLKHSLPHTRIVWLLTQPPSFQSKGGFLTEEVEFMRSMLPWDIIFANKYAVNVADYLSIDVLDLHYYFRYFQNFHTFDGIHWLSIGMRYATNLLLTHAALTWKQPLPAVFPLNIEFLMKEKYMPVKVTSAVLKISRDVRRRRNERRQPLREIHNRL